MKSQALVTGCDRTAPPLATPLRQRIDRRRLLRRLAGAGLALPVVLATHRAPVAAAEPPEPPIAPVHPETRDFSGVSVSDPYGWLEDPTDPDVIAYLGAENAYREAVMAPLTPIQDALYREMLGRIQETDVSVPTPIDDWFYYVRTEEGQQYEILARKQGDLDAPEDILLDLNAILRGDYISLIAWEPSPDHRLLAYVVNETGGDEGLLRIMDLERGVDLPDELYPIAGFAWANDNRTLFYLPQQEDTLRAGTLYSHVLGDDSSADPLRYTEEDDSFELYLSKAKDRSYIFVESFSYETSEIRFLPADLPDAGLTLFAPRQEGVQYLLKHYEDDFLVMTDEDAPNFKVMAAPVASPSPDNWRELVPHSPNALRETWDVLAGHLVIYGREDGLSQVWVRDMASGTLAPLAFDEAVYDVWAGSNWTFDTTNLRIEYTSFVTPISVYEIDLLNGERTLLKQDPVRGGHDPGAYVSERLFATAPDGKQVPISVVRHRDVSAGPRPTLLFGYGAYGYNWPIYFDSNRLSLLDRGVTYAQTHVRGGSELGRSWYEEGKLLNKKNTFTDFIACAEHLIQEGRTAPDQLVANGMSAGGLLMAFIANARPDLFAAVVAEVPWTDVVRTMLDPTIPLVTAEYDEWGDPRDPIYRDYQWSYSPYDNIRAQSYPPMLVTAGLEDDRVMYWDPAKWTARLRATKTDDNPLLLRMNMGAGHAGESGRYDYLQEVAHDTAFMLKILGLEGAPEESQPAATPPIAKTSAAVPHFVASAHPALPATPMVRGSVKLSRQLGATRRRSPNTV